MKNLIFILIAVCNLSYAFTQNKKRPKLDAYDGIQKNAKGDTIWEEYSEEVEHEDHGKLNKTEMLERAKGTQCPVDVYAGADKLALKNIVIKDWKEMVSQGLMPENKLLKVYITGKQWETNKGYDKVSSSYNKYDNTTLQIKMIYQTNDPTEQEIKVARIVFGYIYKNNLNPGSKAELGKITWEYPENVFINLANIK